jgi:hypothetical protein
MFHHHVQAHDWMHGHYHIVFTQSVGSIYVHKLETSNSHTNHYTPYHFILVTLLFQCQSAFGFLFPCPFLSSSLIALACFSTCSGTFRVSIEFSVSSLASLFFFTSRHFRPDPVTLSSLSCTYLSCTFLFHQHGIATGG